MPVRKKVSMATKPRWWGREGGGNIRERQSERETKKKRQKIINRIYNEQHFSLKKLTKK